MGVFARRSWTKPFSCRSMTGFAGSSFTNLWQPWQRAMDGIPATGPRSA